MSRGVILAGGLGTRLRPLTSITNKHLLPVYNKPMIDYPIATLKAIGCHEIVLVSGGEHIGAFAEYLKDGKQHDVQITYRVQPHPGGIAQALLCAEGLVDPIFPVILGDNYFERVPKYNYEPAIYVKKVADPRRFGVYDNNQIIEKPAITTSPYAVTGFYVYDEQVFDIIRQLRPSARGELEITAVNNWYLKEQCKVYPVAGAWSDMGTHESLMEVATHEQNRSL